MTKFECERDGEVRSFETFAECRRFVRREGDQSRLWAYIGTAQLFYIADMEDRAEGVGSTDRLSFREQYENAWATKRSLQS